MILDREDPWFRDLVADLVGFHDRAELLARRDRVLAALPKLRAQASELVRAR